MTDRELLELAAKAADLNISTDGMLFDGDVTLDTWNPLEFNGDAFQLLVDCRFKVNFDVYAKTVTVCGDGAWIEEPFAGNVSEATRKAIVRAAAVLGDLIR